MKKIIFLFFYFVAMLGITANAVVNDLRDYYIGTYMIRNQWYCQTSTDDATNWKTNNTNQENGAADVRAGRYWADTQRTGDDANRLGVKYVSPTAESIAQTNSNDESRWNVYKKDNKYYFENVKTGKLVSQDDGGHIGTVNVGGDISTDCNRVSLRSWGYTTTENNRNDCLNSNEKVFGFTITGWTEVAVGGGFKDVKIYNSAQKCVWETSLENGRILIAGEPDQGSGKNLIDMGYIGYANADPNNGHTKWKIIRCADEITTTPPVVTDITIAAKNGRTQIFSTGDFACLQVTQLKDGLTPAEDGYVWEYSSDNSTWVNGNENGLPDNDTHNNIRPTKAGYYRCKVGDAISNVIQITTTTAPNDYLYANNASTNLPILVIHTGSSKLPGWSAGHTNTGYWDKTKVSADMKIILNVDKPTADNVYSADNKLSDMNNNAKVYYDRKVRINWRGSTSRSMAKRSLAISFGSKSVNVGGGSDGFEKDKFGVFGGPEEKDWILYSVYQDKSMMRNKLAMDIWKSMGYWAGTGTFVELYIDGSYEGVYILMDKYDRSGDRIKVTKQGEGTGSDGQTTGYVLKFDKVASGDPGVWFRENTDVKGLNNNKCGSDGGCGIAGGETKQGWEVVYPDPADWANWNTHSEYTYIKNWLTEFEIALYHAYKGEDDVTYDDVFSEYLDVQSFVDFMILEEFARNTDGYRASMYFSKDVDGKLKCVAPWDFEMGFGNSRTHGGSLTNIWQYAYNCDDNGVTGGDNEPYYPIPFWWKALMNSDCFKNAMKTRWAQLTASGQPLNKDIIWAKVDAMNNQLTNNDAQTREKTRWDWSVRNKVDGTTGADGYKYVPWIIVPWDDGMPNSCDVSNIHPVPDIKYNPEGFTWSGEGESWDGNNGKKTKRWDDEIGLMKAWIYARLDWLNTAINGLTSETKTMAEINACAQTATDYTFSIKNPSATEICAEANPAVEEIELKLNTNITSTYDAEYQWYKDDAAIKKATKKTYKATEAGVYKCVVKVTRIGGIPVWDDGSTYTFTTTNTVEITECNVEWPDEEGLTPDDNRTVCITCQEKSKKFTITAPAGDEIQAVKVAVDGVDKKTKINLNTKSYEVTLSEQLTGKITVTVLTKTHKIVKTFWK